MPHVLGNSCDSSRTCTWPRRWVTAATRKSARTAWRMAAFAAAAVITLAAGIYAARPVQASHWVASGLRLEFSNDYLGAADAYRRALAYDDTNGSAWFNLARTLAKQGQYGEAWQAAEGAKLRVHEEILWVMRVRLLEAMNQPAAALHEATDGMERFPWSGELASDVVRLQGAAAAQNAGWPWGLQLGRP